MNNFDKIKDILAGKGLKSTTQRLIIFEALQNMHNHPTAEDILNHISKSYPSISLSTIYNTLDLFVENKIINKLKNDNGIIRYDAFIENHHHLYCSETDKIEDYSNIELDNLLTKFFAENKISDFEIKDIKLQINGNFLKEKK